VNVGYWPRAITPEEIFMQPQLTSEQIVKLILPRSIVAREVGCLDDASIDECYCGICADLEEYPNWVIDVDGEIITQHNLTEQEAWDDALLLIREHALSKFGYMTYEEVFGKKYGVK
jgi:hypothetical protein